MVRLKEPSGQTCKYTHTNFNSSMVRLKALPIPVHDGITFKFQFQYGAIKSITLTYDEKFVPQFQFQYGAIKSKIKEGKEEEKPDFNSSMVRLKEENLHYVIRTPTDFNSSMVRLKVTSIIIFHVPVGFQFQYGAIKRSNTLPI